MEASKTPRTDHGGRIYYGCRKRKRVLQCIRLQWFSCALLVVAFSLVFHSLLFCYSLFNRVYLSSTLFCACSRVTIAICITSAYMRVICLYMCSYIVCVAVPRLSCAGGQAGTVCKPSVVLAWFVHSAYRRRDRKF